MTTQSKMLGLLKDIEETINTCRLKYGIEWRKYIIDLCQQSNLDIFQLDSTERNLLHYAVNSGDINLIKCLVEDFKLDISITDINQNTILHSAIEGGHIEIVKYLISLKLPINAKNKNGCTALHYAANRDNIEIIKTLILHDGDIKSRNDKGESPIHCAVIKNNKPLLEFLIRKGADIKAQDLSGQTILHLAVNNGDIEIVKYLLNNHCKSLFSICDQKKKHALHYAVEYGDQTILQLLLGKATYIEVKDSDFRTPLHYAIIRKRRDMVKILIEREANLNLTDQFYKTPLHYAVNYVDLELFRYLIERGANVNLVDAKNKTVLHYAIKQNNQEFINYLLTCRTDINIADIKGKTALHHAVKQNNKKLIEDLLRCGADINIADNKGRTVLHYAVSSDNQKLLEYLLSQGANITAKDNDDKTLLHYAVSANNQHLTQCLIVNYADINAIDCNEETIFHYAAKNNNNDLLQYLAKLNIDVNLTNIKNKNAVDLIDTANHQIFKTLLLLGVIVGKNKQQFKAISIIHNELIDIADIAEALYMNETVNISPLLKLLDKNITNDTSYQEALTIIQAQSRSIALLRQGYPRNLVVKLKSLDELKSPITTSSLDKIINDLQRVINSVVPTKFEIGMNIDSDLSILLYKNDPQKFPSLAPYSVLKNSEEVMMERGYASNKYDNEYPHYKTETCFDYIVNPDNYEEVLSILASDSKQSKILMRTLSKLVLYQDDFKKSQVLYDKFFTILEKKETADSDIQVLLQIKQNQHDHILDLLADTKAKLLYEEEKYKKLEEKYAQLEAQVSKAAEITDRCTSTSVINNITSTKRSPLISSWAERSMSVTSGPSL